MAQLSSLTVTSSFDWNATTENTSSAGYMWFDNGTFKISRNAGVWSTGPNMICGRAGPGGLKGSESQNAALSFGGAVPGNRTNLTEEYDGSSWSAGGSLINGRGRGAAAGFQNSGITWGGRNPSIDLFMTCTEEYDGSSWSTGGALGSGGRYQAGTGTQNATLSAGGMFCGDPSYRYSLTFEYNGTSWSSGNCQIHRRIYVGSLGGNQNEAVLAKGRIGPNSTSLTEGWDGIAWSSQNTANLAAQFPSGTGSSSGLIVYGNGNCTTATESYTPQLHAKSL